MEINIDKVPYTPTDIRKMANDLREHVKEFGKDPMVMLTIILLEYVASLRDEIDQLDKDLRG